jgi:hypothetical protein
MSDTSSCTILLGGVNVQFVADEPSSVLECARLHRNFLNKNQPDYLINVKNGCPNQYSFNSPQFVTSNWSYYREDNRAAIRLYSKGRHSNNGHYSIIFFPEERRGELFFENQNTGPTPNPKKLRVPPPSMGELIAVELLSMARGLMFQASGIKTNAGNGLLMAGTSGAGKTTFSKMWVESGSGSFLGDECLTVIVEQQENYSLQSTAWHGSGNPTTSSKTSLSHIFILEHSQINWAKQLKPEEAVPELLSRAFLPFWDRRGMDFTLQFLENLCTSIPVYRLGFTPDQQAVDYVQCLIST